MTLPADQQCRSQCGQPFADFPGTDDTTILEVEVKAHRRLIRRRRYRPTCTCSAHPSIVTPPPPRLIPKSPFGISIWVTVLLDKYQFYRPTHRLLEDLRSHGLDLSQGGLTEGRQRLAPLFEPIYEALVAHNQRQHLWNADETRWFVFASIEGKVGYQWYLWLFQSAEAVVFVLAAGRSHDVPEEHFAPVSDGILVVDRFSAYKAIAKVKAGTIILAFCWAHQRRDFIELARSWPAQQSWASAWLERIGELYALNARRRELRDDSEGVEQRDRDLRAAVDQMAQQAETALAEAALHPACRRVLESLGEHWTGLTVFVGAFRSPDGQQPSRAHGAGSGGGSEELLRLGRRVGRPAGGVAVFAGGDAAAMADQPADVVDGVLDGLRGGGREGAGGRVALAAVESDDRTACGLARPEGTARRRHLRTPAGGWPCASPCQNAKHRTTPTGARARKSPPRRMVSPIVYRATGANSCCASCSITAPAATSWSVSPTTTP